MSPPNAERRPGKGRRIAMTGEVETQSTADRRQNVQNVPDGPATLFSAVVKVSAYGRSVAYEVPDDTRRGPGPRKPTTGPQDASAPAWWVEEASQIVLALVANGHRVSVDDLHARYTDEPSASGAAFGALFAKMAAAGQLVEVGWERSRRPEARARRVVLWGKGEIR